MSPEELVDLSARGREVVLAVKVFQCRSEREAEAVVSNMFCNAVAIYMCVNRGLGKSVLDQTARI